MGGSVNALLSCRNLNFSYGGNGEAVLKDISLTVEKGEAVVLMGPSGCGKSTLAYCLAGLYPEYAGKLTGEIFLGGESLTGLTPNLRARKTSILFQNPDDQFCMDRVDREILFALENINYDGDMYEHMREAIALAGIPELEGERIDRLSGGTKQKVALAAALAVGDRGKSLLILDEPFANIDPGARREIAKRLKELTETAGLTLLIVDHRPDYWKELATRIVVMDDKGRIAVDDISLDKLSANRKLFQELGLFYSENYSGAAAKAAVEDKSAVTAENLSAGYGKTEVITSVSMKIQKGQIVAVMGKNGSGKTTLLWALAGLIRHKGRLTTSGRIGVVFQNPGYQFLTQQVLEEVLYTLKAANPNAENSRLLELARSRLKEFKLEDYENASPYMLSQGQQRRLAVLSMLVGGQEILLLDEPTYAQDERATRFIMERLTEQAAGGLAVLFTTHDPALAEAYAHKIIRLDKGVPI